MKMEDNGDLNLDKPTEIETAMACGLAYWNLPYQHQYKLGKYVLDFTIIHGDYKIDVECDGDEFHKSTREQSKRDDIRNKFVISKGWLPIRFSGAQIYKNPVFCAEKIKNILEQK